MLTSKIARQPTTYSFRSQGLPSIVHGRQTLCPFGAPCSIRDLLPSRCLTNWPLGVDSGSVIDWLSRRPLDSLLNPGVGPAVGRSTVVRDRLMPGQNFATRDTSK